jgi:uncharacterized protein (TIGR02246 family)
MRTYRGLSLATLAIAILLLAAGSTGARAAKPTAAAAKRPSSPPTRNAADLRKVSEEWARLWSAKQLDPIVALYAADAVFLPSTGGRITGQAAIRDLFARALAVNSPSITVVSLTIEQSGDLAYDSGDYVETLTSGGATHGVHGSYLVVLRRGADGTWRIVQHVWTEAPAGAK